MKLSKGLLFLFILVVFSTFSFAQTKTGTLPKPKTTPPPGSIKLLDGYIHEQKQGIDSRVGVIYKKDGLHIGYDIGRMAGNMTNRYIQIDKDKLDWSKKLEVKDDSLLIAYFKNGKIMATFQKQNANFFADTKKQEEIVDFIMMVITYG